MEREATIGQAKARRRSETAVVKKFEVKKNSTPRNPFNDCNVGSIASLQASAEAQRKGCFRFLLPDSSSKNDSVPRSKSHSRTPKSAPPNSRALSSKTITYPSSIRNRNPPSPISENPRKLGSKMPLKPKTPDLLLGWNQRKACSKELSRGKGKSGSCLSSTPERVISVVELNPCSLGEECKQLLTATPTSNSTPPIQASISPEVPCSSSVTPMPVCFATGHIIAGVKDRRKCRPRGVLTIGQRQSDGFQVSSPPSSLAGASICWVSSPLEIPNGSTQGSRVRSGGCDDEASVRWLVSPGDAVKKELETVSDQQKTNLDVMFGIETTPPSGAFILRTPTSNSSTSPFSVIVQKAKVSGLPLISSDKEKGEHRYANGKEVSPFSEKSWSKVNDISTPSSYSNSRRNGVISPLENDSAMDRFKAMRISPRPIPLNNKNVVSPLPSLSFKFCSSPTPLNSIDFNCFRSSRAAKLSKEEAEETNAKVSSMTISWREGLLSRIFETGELDSYQCFFDEDGKENFDGPTDEAKSEPDFKYDQVATSLLKERSGFGSFEFLVCSNESGFQRCQPKLPLLEPNSAAESISTEVGGLISSGESDWTQFYRNNLFEV